LAGGFDRAGALALAEAGGADDRVLLVGHEPDFSQVVHDLTGARVDLKKGGVAAVRLDGTHSGELLVLLRPRELEAIAAAP
jgi:phosphohistidine phosphatase